MRVLREVGVVRHGVGLLCIVEVVASGVSELGGDGRDDAGCGPLLDRLIGEDSGGLGAASDSFCSVVKFRCSPVAIPPGFTALATMPSDAQRRVASTAKREFAVFDWA